MKKELLAFEQSEKFEFALEGSAILAKGILSLTYEFRGDTDRIDWGDSHAPFRRETGLWEKTCFEAFIGNTEEKQYWEFNCSPALEWNVFSFEDYRQGMKEELNVPLPAMTFNGRCFCATFDLRKIPLHSSEVSLTSVIVMKPKIFSYWAWKHESTKADFHRRGSFFVIN